MSGETERYVSGWTTDTLHAHLSQRLDDSDRRYEQRFESQERAIDKANTATEKRFEGVNEFRSQLADQARTFLPRQEYEARHETLVEAHTALTSRLDKIEGSKGGTAQTLGLVVGAGGLLIAAVTVIVSIVMH